MNNNVIYYCRNGDNFLKYEELAMGVVFCIKKNGEIFLIKSFLLLKKR